MTNTSIQGFDSYPVKKNYPTVDLLKFIFALFIVALHSELLSINSSIGSYMANSVLFRLAVPYFFTVSGYFLSQKLIQGKASAYPIIKSYCLRLVPPLVFYGGIGLVFKILSSLRSNTELQHIADICIKSLFYPENSMWYLAAAIFGAVIVSLIFINCKAPKTLWVIYSIVAFSFTAVCNNYFFAVQNSFLEKAVTSYLDIFVSARNGIFLAPVYMGMGFVISLCKQQLSKIKSLFPLLTAIGFASLSFEAFMLYKLPFKDDRSIFMSHLLLIPSLVCLSLEYDIKLQLPYTTLRRLSTSIYYMHATFIRNVLIVFFALFPIGAYRSIVTFVLTVTVTISLSLVLYRLEVKWLKPIIG